MPQFHRESRDSLQISVIISTFERPGHLERCLWSLAYQQGVDGKFEVIVTDDGSRDDTLAKLELWRKRLPYPLHVTSHAHEGFWLSCCRNQGIAASRSEYLLFSDGDCLFPPDHLHWQLTMRRPGIALLGDCWRLTPEVTARVDQAAIAAGSFLQQIPTNERWRLRRKWLSAQCYSWLGVRGRPRMTGCNVSVWRSDAVRVNGFDEAYRGWGLEDRDFQRRLERTGVRFRTILGRTAVCHLWHPPHATFARKGLGTANFELFHRSDVPIACEAGLSRHVAQPSHWEHAA